MEKYKITYLKRTIKKLNKCFNDKKEIKYKKLETNILKSVTSSIISKNVKNYLKKLFIIQSNKVS